MHERKDGRTEGADGFGVWLIDCMMGLIDEIGARVIRSFPELFRCSFPPAWNRNKGQEEKTENSPTLRLRY